MSRKALAEYIWLDGTSPTQELRSKTKVLQDDGTGLFQLADVPMWAFDGSSTFQAPGNASDCLLRPVRVVQDPFRGGGSVLVLCEVLYGDGVVHATNHRNVLRSVVEQHKAQESWCGIEQEYTLFQDGRPLGWPKDGFPAPQGPYYCGVGANKVFGRELVERHLALCLDAKLSIAGINAEVMPAQWEFQVGPLSPLQCADELWLARWLLQRVGEEYGVVVSYDPKPVPGDWNGAGAHINFSTAGMRATDGLSVIEEACRKLSEKHEDHIKYYGADNERRLTGKHETCSIKEFRWGMSDRGASVRIPFHVAIAKCGYLEDRRPAANMDPYQALEIMIRTILS